MADLNWDAIRYQGDNSTLWVVHSGTECHMLYEYKGDYQLSGPLPLDIFDSLCQEVEKEGWKREGINA